MIESLTFKEVPESLFPWASQIDYFQKNPVTTFKPGLNIVYGANGSGKSTLLKLLGLTLAAVQGGTSTVTQSWLSDILSRGESPASRLPCAVTHDGQPVMYHDAREVVGLFQGAAFDDDFFSQGVNACLAKGSVGQLSMHRAARLFEVLAKVRKGFVPADAGFPKDIAWKVSRKTSSERFNAQVRAADDLLTARCAPGPQTLLFDEPESGFSMPWQAGTWKNLFSTVNPDKLQVIVATHSPFALEIPNAHYIEMTPGYAQECLVTLLMDLKHKVPFMFAA